MSEEDSVEISESTDDRRERVRCLLATAQSLQTQFWDALGELEGELGGDPDTIELSTVDLEEYDVDTLIETWDALNEEDEPKGGE